ncbi:MAG: succinate dehydrogenase cytochrome b subunit [Bacteroidota bacterium]
MGITQTTLIKKILMALTGLFLSFFLIIHLLGNLQLILPEEIGHSQFNHYSVLLSELTIIKVISYFLYATILYHVFDALWITIANWRANDKKYKKDNRAEVSGWISRNMGFLGSLIFIFLVIHFKDYWYVFKFGELPLDAEGNKDIYLIVVTSFKNIWWVILYEIALISLGLHLIHGVSSAFRTLGVYHPKYILWIKYLGYAFSIAITIGYMIIPVFVYFFNPL